MKNKKIFIATFVFLSFVIVNNTFADTSIILKIKTRTSTIYNQSIVVTPCDSDNEGGMRETPYCAILQSNVSSDWDWSWAPGAFITSVNGIEGFQTEDNEGNPVYHYWSWSLNGKEAGVGLNQYDLKPNDIVLLEFIDPVIKEIVPEVETPKRHSSSSGYKAPVLEERTFSYENAIDFLNKKQKEDGSFGSPMYTDWVAVAIGGLENENIKTELVDYLKKNNIDSTVITDYERRAMALMALGLDPYNNNGINYIKKIIDSFDGIQFGDVNLINDDIFALIVLNNAGYTKDDGIISKDLKFVISNQQDDGSWGSVDMTSASILALNLDKDNDDVNKSIKNAQKYLNKNQKDDGSFGDSFSTSWVMQSLVDNDRVKKAESYLISKQQDDGGIENKEDDINTRIWATSYALLAMRQKSWNDVLENFPKLIIENKVENIIDNKKILDNPVNKLKKVFEIKKAEVQPKENENKVETTSMVSITDETNSRQSSIGRFLRRVISPIINLFK